MPAAPDDHELGGALRLVADAARRLRAAWVRTSLVMAGQDAWLQGGGSAALVVARLSELPGATRLLPAAGFTSSARGWAAPGASSPVPRDDGIVAAVLSPWDGRSPQSWSSPGAPTLRSTVPRHPRSASLRTIRIVETDDPRSRFRQRTKP